MCCRAWPKVRLTWSAVPRSVNSWRLWEGTERDKYKWCLMLSLETSWADLVLFCRNIASLFLKPQKRLASAAPSVKAFLLPLFCCSEFDSCYLSWCPLVQVLQEVRTMGIYPPSLHTVTFLQTFFSEPSSHLFHTLLCPNSLICSLHSRFLCLWSSVLPFSEHFPLVL